MKHRYTAYRMGRLSVAATLGDGGVNDTWKERKGTFFGSRNLRQYCAIAPAVNCRQYLPVFGIQENMDMSFSSVDIVEHPLSFTNT